MSETNAHLTKERIEKLTKFLYHEAAAQEIESNLGTAKMLESSADCINSLQYQLAAARADVAELVASLRDTLFAAQNADETGYVADVGFVNLDAIHEEAHALLNKHAAMSPPVAPRGADELPK